jgi:hypothetical protein
MEKEKCKHILDKNHKYCMICGMLVVSERFIPATEEMQKEWQENPIQFLRKNGFKI